MKKMTVIGATGSTGRPTCDRLLPLLAGQTELRLVVAGRDRRELERVSLELSKKHRQAVDIAVFELADRASLRQVCDNSAVVINCAAPYSVTGPSILATAINAKAHLLDAGNELGHIEQCALRDSLAREAGVAVVNGVAIDPGLGDLCTAVGAKKFEAVQAVHVLYMYRDLEESDGMRASMMESFRQPCRVYVDRTLTPSKVAGKKREFKWSGGAAKGKLMPGGEVFLLPRHQAGVRHIHTYRTLDGKFGMKVSMLGTPLSSVGLMMLSGWARERVRPSAHDPSGFAVIVEIEGLKGRRFVVTQGKAIYHTTGAMLAHMAHRLATERPRATGVISPAQAVDADWLLDKAGLSVQVADAALV